MISRKAAMDYPADKVIYRPPGKPPEVGEIVALTGFPDYVLVRYGSNRAAKRVKLEDLEWLEPH